MRHALVTGGTGRVGHFITRALRAEGWEVTLLSRHAPPPELHAGHIPFSLDAPPPPLPPADALVHAAFDHLPDRYRGGEGDDAEGFRRRNEAGSIALFEAAKAARIPRALFLSTRAVYGPHAPGETLTEDMEPRPDTLYGEVKLSVERALAAMTAPGFTPVTLRATGVYGPPPQGGTHKWAALFDDFLAGKPIAPRAGTEVHGDDLAAAALLLLTLEAPLVSARVFNVSDILLDRHDLLALVSEVLERPLPLPPRADASEVNAMDTSRLSALGWTPGGRARLAATVPALLQARP